jgi:hypothetical protein
LVVAKSDAAAIAHQTASEGVLPEWVDRRQRTADRQRRQLFRSPAEKGTVADRTAPTCCCEKVAKAVSRSLSVLAFTTMSCRPSARAAACRSVMTDWVSVVKSPHNRNNLLIYNVYIQIPHLALLIVVAIFILHNYLLMSTVFPVCHNCSRRLPDSRCKMKCRMTAGEAIDFVGQFREGLLTRG